jgi:uncharacterized RDD family membrane protein YckC
MKCPKCGYLGFETTDRCRNCQYDFSLSPFPNEPELALNTRTAELSDDLDLAPIQRSAEPARLDLDRLFGEPDQKPSKVMAAESPVAEEDDDQSAALEAVDEPRAAMSLADRDDVEERETASAVTEGERPMMATPDEGALPFDDAPIVPPPARPPLAVRRSTPEVPRHRPRTTRPIRPESLKLESPADTSIAEEAAETMQSLLEPPPLAARVGAGLIDLLLLVGIDATILYLTLKITGLQSTLDDLRVLPAVPFVGFLALLAFGYVGAFTVAGGQTIGKMLLSLRVIGDDGRPIDAAGGMLRALGCMLVPVTFGLSYLPALFTSDHRAIHDRLAGTRVVRE